MGKLRDKYGRWAVVVGGTSGIGRALAEQLAADGMDIVLVARGRAALGEVAGAIREAYGVEVLTIAADMAAADGVETVLAGVAALEVGVLVPAAGIESTGWFVDTDVEVYRRMLKINVEAPLRLAHAIGRDMAQRGRGAVLLVSSLSGWTGQPMMASYGATKAYVLSLGEALHRELQPRGVDVAVLSPGSTKTPMLDTVPVDFAAMGMAMMAPEAVAAAALAGLGKGPHVVPGWRNRMMVFMMTRMMPRAWGTAMMVRMLARAMPAERLALPRRDA